MSRKTKRVVERLTLTLIVLIALVAFNGCGSNGITEDEAKEAVLNSMGEKYGSSFRIESVEKNDVGQNYTKEIFSFQLSDEQTPGLFEAIMNEDGTDPRDNYAKILFGSEIETELQGILSEYDGLETEYFLPHYELTERRWTSKDEYMKSEDFSLRCELKPTASEEDEALEETHEWMTEMNEINCAFMMTIQYGQKRLTILCDDDHPLKTLSELKETWRETEVIQ